MITNLTEQFDALPTLAAQRTTIATLLLALTAFVVDALAAETTDVVREAGVPVRVPVRIGQAVSR